MKRDNISRELRKHVSKTASLHDYKKTAHAIYFIVKQYDLSTRNRRVYITMFKEVKKMLIGSFGWRMIEIHKCFCCLNGLMGYIGKKD